MSRIDTLSDLTVMHKMIYVEFLCFLSRVAHNVYETTKYSKLGLHLKVDLIFTKLFDTYQLVKTFSFKDELENIEIEESSDEDASDDATSNSSDHVASSGSS